MFYVGWIITVNDLFVLGFFLISKNALFVCQDSKYARAAIQYNLIGGFYYSIEYVAAPG
jgi:hypothetical protein